MQNKVNLLGVWTEHNAEEGVGMLRTFDRAIEHERRTMEKRLAHHVNEDDFNVAPITEARCLRQSAYDFRDIWEAKGGGRGFGWCSFSDVHVSASGASHNPHLSPPLIVRIVAVAHTSLPWTIGKRRGACVELSYRFRMVIVRGASWVTARKKV